jgi:molybdopterin molybdotransferase
MVGSSEMLQRISRLTPLDAVFAAVDGLAKPVSICEVDVALAVGQVLATDVNAPAALPEIAIALRDGWAVRSDLIADAGSYTPTPVVPPPNWVEAGEPVGAPADAVLPPDAVTVRDGAAEALASATPGDGVLPARSDTMTGQTLRRAGERLRAVDVAALHAARVSHAQVRSPHVLVVSLNATIDAAGDTVGPLIARAVERDGGTARVQLCGDGGERVFAAALADEDGDAVIAVGGTGRGRRDFAIRVLAQTGAVAVHGIGLIPGETAAIGSVGTRPVLLLPGRLDAALAVYLAVGRRMLSRLTGAAAAEPARAATLTRKLVSTVGMAEIALVRHREGGVEPVATSVFPLHALARADGYVLVPADSEGYRAGAVVEMRALP